MQILLTGADGFVGSHLSRRLVEEGYDVHAIIRHRPVPNKLADGITPYIGDLLDSYSLKKIVTEVQPECIVHLAAMTPVMHSFQNPVIYAETNFIGTINLTLASQESHVLRKFIVASTAEVYKADKEKLLTEEDELYGSTPYGVSKVAVDYWTRVAGKCYGLPYIVMRPSNTYSRKSEKRYFVEKVIDTMLKSNRLELDGTSDSVRDWLFVDDHVEGYIQAIKSDCINEVFNISTGVGTSTGNVVAKVREMLNWKGEVSWGTHQRPFEPKYLVLDNSKAKKMIGFQPKITLEEGINRIIKG